MPQRAAGAIGVTVQEFRGIMHDSLLFAAAFGAEIIEMGEGRAAAVLSAIGPVELAVTTRLTINFLRKPPPAAIRAEAKLLKLGLGPDGQVALLYESERERVAR